MKKLFLYTTLIFGSLVSSLQASGFDEAEIIDTETLPETGMSEPIKIVIGLFALTLAVLVYKIQIDLKKIRQENFESKIVGGFEKED